MGAGIQECDVTFTKDRGLPAAGGKPAKAECCTSDITIDEYRSLCAKMDGFNATATTPADYLRGTPSWRTDLYATCAKVMTLEDHISLVTSLGLKFTPEIKTPMIPMPFQGNYTQEIYAQQVIDTFKKYGVPPEDVYVQSFLYADILYLLKNEPDFGKQAVLLDQSGDKPATVAAAAANLTTYANDGLRIIAPPLPYLVEVQGGELVASEYAKKAKELGLKIITWTFERSPPTAQIQAKGDYYYNSLEAVLKTDGDVYKVLDALWQKVGVYAVFSDWSATVTFYANCFGIDI
ncbi:hypothetical protein NLG97_g11199 [Lecanicillium saksenae]|uniref:Uncharacterized protein n=1 Tax=Lecanicillium saksenae TaxID=468837 RepID=A0ACC1QCV2_9HYPO|nr:hypothetical protein NLG97_g11199 [Lecanicillium saksenae]